MFTRRENFLGKKVTRDIFFHHEDTVDVDTSFQQCETHQRYQTRKQVKGGVKNSMSNGRPKSIGMWDISNIRVTNQYYSGRRSAVVKRVEHISTIVLVNIWVAQVRVPLVLSVGIWICKNLNYQCLTTNVAVVLVVRWYFNGWLVLFCVQCRMCRKRLSSPRCRSELIDSAWVVIVPGQKCINKKIKKNIYILFFLII